MYAAKAAFAACSSNSDECISPVNISVTVGENIVFNASVTHIQGGRCGFKQVVDRVILKRCTNNDCTSESSLLSIIAQNQVTNLDDRVSTSPEKDHLILSNSIMNDSGLYEIEIQGVHPRTSEFTSVTRKCWVTVKGKLSIYFQIT